MAFGDKVDWKTTAAITTDEIVDNFKHAIAIESVPQPDVVVLNFKPFEAVPMTRAEVESVKNTLAKNTEWFEIQDVGLPFQQYIKERKPILVQSEEFDLPAIKMKCMPCHYCAKPVVLGLDVPVVLEWGTRTPDMPAFVGTPYKIVAHQNCNAEARRKK